MKNKSVLLTAIVMLWVNFASIACSSNLYSGTYTCDENSRLILKLRGDYTFELINSFGKNSECNDGKYSVKDNNIILEFNKEPNIYSFKNLSGKVQGSKLSFDKDKLAFSRR